MKQSLHLTSLLALLTLVMAPDLARAVNCRIRTQGRTEEQIAADRIQCEGRNFLEQAQGVQRREPTLYRNADFAEFQKWTLDHQRYIARNRTTLQRIFVTRPEHVPIEWIADAYEDFATKSSELLPQTFEELDLHRSMFTDAEHDRRYVQIFDRALRDLVPGEDGSLPRFEGLDCDYMAQPMNAMWFSMNAARILDSYGQAIHGEAWAERRAQIHADNVIIEQDQFRQISEAGFAYSPAPQFADPEDDGGASAGASADDAGSDDINADDVLFGE